MIILYIDGTKKIEVGQQTVVYSEFDVRMGETVEFRSQMGEFLGTRPIAYGCVVGKCENEPNAPVTPTKTNYPKQNAWRCLYRIKVEEIV